MKASDPLKTRNRAILCHFDGYSTALVFARWPEGNLLWPAPLPADAVPLDAPSADEEVAALGESLRLAAVSELALNGSEVVRMPEFAARFQAGDEILHVHLLRFTGLDAPSAAIETAGAAFKPLPALRGAAPVELGLLRVVFNLTVGGAARL